MFERGRQMIADKSLSDYFDEENEQILEKIMIDYGNELTFLAYSYVKNIEVAKDIVQNVFITAFTQLKTFRGDSSVKTWLYRITINKCKDHLKSSLFKRIVLFGTSVEGKQTVASSDDILLEKELAQSIKKAVFNLKLKYREVILMMYYQDLTTSEIAAILNLPESTVRTRIRRAKQQLAPLLEKEGIIHE
jgi:RNA polymerase sigma-70 factor, ECF subfamily